MKRNIYVASSWRNALQPQVVADLRAAGHEVYDFRNPEPGNTGFSWSAIDPEWKQWTPEQFRAALSHPVAQAGYGLDWSAMLSADTCVMVMPCGRSAHIEAGYFVGAGKKLIILVPEASEPELMYKMADYVCVSMDEVLEDLQDDLAEDSLFHYRSRVFTTCLASAWLVRHPECVTKVADVEVALEESKAAYFNDPLFQRLVNHMVNQMLAIPLPKSREH